nr:flagellin [Pseudemcibacter aquimaris]
MQAITLQFGLPNIDLYNDTNAGSTLTVIENAIDTVNGHLSSMGSASKRVDLMITMNSKVKDAIEVGVGNLVDADMARESADLQSLQVKQQLGIQALSIANQAPNTVLGLFR